ncbi:MAG: VOC family protein [Acidimicrobiales bacterium]
MGTEATTPRAVTMIYVESPKRSKAFFRDEVGLAMTVDGGAYAEFEWGNLILGLRWRDNARNQFADAVAPAGTGASHQITVVVDDVDAVARAMVSRGLDLDEAPTDRAWGLRSATFRDPDGHLFEVGSLT